MAQPIYLATYVSSRACVSPVGLGLWPLDGMDTGHGNLMIGNGQQGIELMPARYVQIGLDLAGISSWRPVLISNSAVHVRCPNTTWIRPSGRKFLSLS
jgi:hypothetical protein